MEAVDRRLEASSSDADPSASKHLDERLGAINFGGSELLDDCELKFGHTREVFGEMLETFVDEVVE